MHPIQLSICITPLHQLDPFSIDVRDKSSVEIMLKHVSPEKAVNITWLSVAMTFCWPLPVNSSKIKVIGYKITQICATVSITLLLLPLLYSIYLRPDDIEIISTSVGQSICMIQSIIQTVICFRKHDTLQVSTCLFSLVSHVKGSIIYATMVCSV
ncbi:hypothetical protein K0M31_002124 [Melipona bicolor]|uniref:Uncharacterized protein n=1 Tax=Melipona bicolor TaxID=60889 RepID=A0AA40GGY3_9HYME|nr:hypothetical protein K0M31_002124 [Melipona bicolor]